MLIDVLQLNVWEGSHSAVVEDNKITVSPSLYNIVQCDLRSMDKHLYGYKSNK